MHKELFINNLLIHQTFETALTSPDNHDVHLIHSLRNSLSKHLIEAFSKQGLLFNNNQEIKAIDLKKSKQTLLSPIKVKDYNYKPLDIAFCGFYGIGINSARSLNFSQKRRWNTLDALLSDKDYSIGNLAFVVENGDYEISINCCSSINPVGYSYDISPLKKKSNFCLWGIRFDNDYLKRRYINLVKNCKCEDSHLVSMSSEFPVLYMCKICGKVYTCKCFENHQNPMSTEEHFTIRENLCHLCTNRTPSIYSLDPYILLYMAKQPDISYRESENLVRERFGYPKIGEGWVSETALYKTVQSLLPDKEVIFHYRGRELQGLELDIWIPELKLGIEYQGEQHYKPLKHWGGESGLEKRKQNDYRKKEICKSLGYNLIEIKYNDPMDAENIMAQLRHFI